MSAKIKQGNGKEEKGRCLPMTIRFEGRIKDIPRLY